MKRFAFPARPRSPLRPRGTVRGITLVEMAIAVVILAMVLALVHGGTVQGLRMFSTGETSLGLEDQGRAAMDRITKDLRGAGIAENPAAPGETYAYPYVWTGNNPQGPYTSLILPSAKEPVHFITDTDDPAFAPSSSLVFLEPIVDGSTVVDDSGDGLPLVWSPAPPDPAAQLVIHWGGRTGGGANPLQGSASNAIVYRLEKHPTDDYNRLVRYETGTGTETNVCNYVERIVFEYYATGAVAQQSQIRIRLFLRRRDQEGNWLQADLSAVVAMRSI